MQTATYNICQNMLDTYSKCIAAYLNIRWKGGGNSCLHDTTQEHMSDANSPDQSRMVACEYTQHGMRQPVTAKKALCQLP